MTFNLEYTAESTICVRGWFLTRCYPQAAFFNGKCTITIHSLELNLTGIQKSNLAFTQLILGLMELNSPNKIALTK